MDVMAGTVFFMMLAWYLKRPPPPAEAAPITPPHVFAEALATNRDQERDRVQAELEEKRSKDKTAIWMPHQRHQFEGGFITAPANDWREVGGLEKLARTAGMPATKDAQMKRFDGHEFNLAAGKPPEPVDRNSVLKARWDGLVNLRELGNHSLLLSAHGPTLWEGGKKLLFPREWKDEETPPESGDKFPFSFRAAYGSLMFAGSWRCSGRGDGLLVMASNGILAPEQEPDSPDAEKGAVAEFLAAERFDLRGHLKTPAENEALWNELTKIGVREEELLRPDLIEPVIFNGKEVTAEAIQAAERLAFCSVVLRGPGPMSEPVRARSLQSQQWLNRFLLVCRGSLRIFHRGVPGGGGGLDFTGDEPEPAPGPSPTPNPPTPAEDDPY